MINLNSLLINRKLRERVCTILDGFFYFFTSIFSVTRHRDKIKQKEEKHNFIFASFPPLETNKQVARFSMTLSHKTFSPLRHKKFFHKAYGMSLKGGKWGCVMKIIIDFTR